MNEKTCTVEDYYPIGTQVMFMPIKLKYNDQNHREIVCFCTYIRGWIVGVKDVPMGIYKSGGYGSAYQFDEPDYDPPYLQITHKVRLYRVRTSLLGKEELAEIHSTKKCDDVKQISLLGAFLPKENEDDQ